MRIKVIYSEEQYNFKFWIPILKEEMTETIKYLKDKISYHLSKEFNVFLNDFELKSSNYLLFEEFMIGSIINDEDQLNLINKVSAIFRTDQSLNKDKTLELNESFVDHEMSDSLSQEIKHNYEAELKFSPVKFFKKHTKVLTMKHEKHVNPENYTKIPSFYIENYDYLKENYPELFITGTDIYYKRYEFIDSYRIRNSIYKFGKIISYNEYTKSFLISLKNSDENEFSASIINIELKDFIELWVFNPEKTMKNNTENSDIECIKRQLEFYFSNENLENDNYLLENIDEAGYFPIYLISKFNRIKSITNKISDIVLAVKKSNILELSKNNEKLRKIKNF